MIQTEEIVLINNKTYNSIPTVRSLIAGDIVMFKDLYKQDYVECRVKHVGYDSATLLALKYNKKVILYIEDGYNSNLVYKSI